MMVVRMLGLIWQAFRSWKTALPVAVLAAAGLAIGIGSAVGIFSVVEAVLLKPLPYANAERYLLVRGEWRIHPGAWTILSYGDFKDYAARNSTLETIGCYQGRALNVTFRGKPSHVFGAQISPSLLPMLGVNPVQGQLFGEKDQEVVLLSERLWRRLGSDPAIIGNALKINGVSYTVVGVMPGWFRFPDETQARSELWVPLNPDRDQLRYRAYHYLNCLALPKAGVSEKAVREDLQRILEQLRVEHPGDQAEPEVITTTPLLPEIVRYIRPRLLLLLGAALALLLITCANVASVLLARSVARRRETAVRVALGATQWQLAVQYFFEGLVVALAGAALGSVLAYVMVHGILTLAADAIPRADQISADIRVLAFAVAIAFWASIFFSLAPLWQASRTQPNDVLSDGARSSASGSHRRILRFFVVGEVMLSFVLLAIGGVLWERLNGLNMVNPGFDADHLLLAHLQAPEATHPGKEQISYRAKLLAAIQGLPGVEAAGFSSLMPFVGNGNNTALQVQGRPQKPWAEVTNGFIEDRYISPSYFQTLRIPLLAGRYLNESDESGKVVAMVINQALAREEWPNESPVGSYVRTLGLGEQLFQVVGVVGDVRNFGLEEPAHPEFYVSYRVYPTTTMQWAIRSSLDVGRLTAEVRRAVERIDPEQTIYEVQTMREAINDSLSTDVLQSILLGFFAVAALALSVIGVYGVVSYTVRQRTTEMGTRMALGADSRSVLKLVMGDGLRMSVSGTAAGALVLLALAKVLASTEFHVQIADAWPFLFSCVVIGSLTLLASWFPAWRAAGLPPMVAIRNDMGSAWQESKLHYRQLWDRASSNVATQDMGVEQATLLSNMVAAGRDAESFPQAIAAALQTLREAMGVDKVELLAQLAADQPYRATEDAQVFLPVDSFLVRRLKGLSSPLPLSGAELDAWEHWASENSPSRLEEIATLRKLDPALAVAVFSKNEVIGVLLLGQPAKGGYSTEALRSLAPAAAQLGLMLENGRLTGRIVEQERLRRELLLATEVQKRLFPQAWPQTTSIQLAGLCMPARGVGGDYYDFLDLGDRQIGVALADVAGKGIAAALIMSIVQASLRSLTEMRNGSLGDLATKMNHLLHRSTGSNSYATFFYAQVDEKTHELRYVNAGHNPPMLFRGAGWETGHVPFVASTATVDELSTGGTIIGMFAQAAYEEARVQLRSGDVLMLFSDGVSEAHNPAEEEFGEERLKELLRKVAALPVNDMCRAVMQALQEWMLEAPQHDDLTFVLMKVG
jgi:putative ABC transport system permease protein